MRIAAIDLGSNSFHMLIADFCRPQRFDTILTERMAIQIGKDALQSGTLHEGAIANGLRCLGEFRRIALSRGVERIVAVATSAIREAANGSEFIRRARTEAGIVVRTISGLEEARLIHLAVSRYVDLGVRKTLLIDIGGGSIELTVADSATIHFSTSLKLGFLRLQKHLNLSDPMTGSEERRLAHLLEEKLADALPIIRKHKPLTAIATSGTATTLLRLARQRRSNGGSSDAVCLEEVGSILERASRLSFMDRARKLDLDELRSENLPVALTCLTAILEGAGIPELRVCSAGLREGLVYDFMSRAKPLDVSEAAPTDYRLQAVLDLARRYGYPEEHSRKVAALACEIFRRTSHIHRLGDREERLLEHAGILHDVGYHIAHRKHHVHGYYLIMHGDLRGFSSEEKAMLAHLVRYHRGAKPKRSHEEFAMLPRKARLTIARLAAILRIADGLDRSHFSLIDRLYSVTRRGRTIRFNLLTSAPAADVSLDLDAAKGHARYFEKVFGVETYFSARPSGAKASGRNSVRPRRKSEVERSAEELRMHERERRIPRTLRLPPFERLRAIGRRRRSANHRGNRSRFSSAPALGSRLFRRSRRLRDR